MIIYMTSLTIPILGKNSSKFISRNDTPRNQDILCDNVQHIKIEFLQQVLTILINLPSPLFLPAVLWCDVNCDKRISSDSLPKAKNIIELNISLKKLKYKRPFTHSLFHDQLQNRLNVRDDMIFSPKIKYFQNSLFAIFYWSI